MTNEIKSDIEVMKTCDTDEIAAQHNLLQTDVNTLNDETPNTISIEYKQSNDENNQDQQQVHSNTDVVLKTDDTPNPDDVLNTVDVPTADCSISTDLTVLTSNILYPFGVADCSCLWNPDPNHCELFRLPVSLIHAGDRSKAKPIQKKPKRVAQVKSTPTYFKRISASKYNI
jgi:hypothetical protein